MDYTSAIKKVFNEVSEIDNIGKVANYIPELGHVEPNKFGVFLHTIDDQKYGLGDALERFSIQSISKVLTLTMALSFEDENIWQRVGVEPSGTPFNSLVQLEADKGIPRNPFINAGALVVCDILVDYLENPKADFLAFVRELAQNENINYNENVANSEKDTSFRNAALISLMRSFGNIKNDIYVVLDFYIYTCSIDLTCEELAKVFLFLANYGLDPNSKKRYLTVSQSKRVNAIMQLCGFYDEAGEFSFRVGLPGKSGVGGGIVAILPNKYAIAVWSPPLNEKGNSEKGIAFLELFTTETQVSVF